MRLKADVAEYTDESTHWAVANPARGAGLGALRDTEAGTWLVSRIGGFLGGGRTIRLLEVMGRSPGLFWGYLPFALRVVPGSSLSRVDCELATLRTAWDAGARYEWHHHVYAARLSGLSVDTVERVAQGPDAPGWTGKQQLLLRAVDELHADRMISDPTWAGLSQHLSPGQLAELCLLVGHYDMLAMLLKSHGVEPEPEMWRRGPLRWIRDPASGDGILPSWLPRVNKLVINRIQGVAAGKVPPYVMIHHLGRRSGKPYRIPVVGIHTGDQLVVPLPYGDKADWVRNVLAAGSAEITYRGKTQKVTEPRVVDAAGAEELPALARLCTRLVRVIVFDIAE
ncbi:nitroreductase family deazaflavin-dependent oxidoreductase [Nocardia sp. NPDC051832]|uniref:nitroreductase family deazaflavin-dependent oxidoreductase n=1 Tax=Nocardia sp. NPDC051832 TaxID=3155673 RepID=UPI0034170641